MKTRKRRLREPSPFASSKWHERRRYPLACLILIALSLAVYADSFSAGFALDSVPLLEDQRIREASARTLREILQHTYWWPTGESGLYRPLTTLSWLLNYVVLGNGENPAGYHWVNWLLHAANVILVFTLATRLGCRFRISFCAAALWAVHPVLTESVTNIAGRADLLGGMAVLGGFLLYLRSAQKTGWRRAGWLIGLAAAAGAGACSKESAVVLPGVIVLYEVVWWKPLRWRTLIWGCAATLAPIGVVLWQRSAVLAAALPAEFPFVDNPIAGADFWRGRLTAIAVLGRYLWLFAWPLRLSCDYSYSEIPLATGSATDWAAWMTVALATGAAILAYRRSRITFFLACFACLTLLPASNLVFPTGTIMAERLLYLPAMGLAAILAILIETASARLPRPPVAMAVIIGAIVICYGLRTSVRNKDWRDDLTMAAASVLTSPNSFKVHHLLAVSLYLRDRSRSTIDRVIAEGEKSLAILAAVPDEQNTASAGNIAGRAHLAKGDLDSCSGGDGGSGSCSAAEARTEYERAAQIALRATEIEAAGRAAYNRRHGTHIPPDAGAAESFRILASARLRLGEAEPALAAAMSARAIDPSAPEAYTEIAQADLAAKRGEDAAVDLVEGMMITSDPAMRADLLTVYQSGLTNSACAVVPGPNGPALNPSCDIVRRDFCAAAAEVRRQDVLEQLGCVSRK